MSPDLPPLYVYATPNGIRASLSVNETASLLGVSPESVRKMIRVGELWAVRPTGKGGRLLIPVQAIEHALAPERRVTVVDEGAIA